MCTNITDLKHLSFEEFFHDDWRNYFQEKETIQSIMDSAGLSSSHDFVQVKARYLIDDDRIAVVALIKRKNTEVLEKLIIDIVAGNSSFEQIYDVAYSIGAGCDYRLIICDWNSKNNHPGLRMTDDIMCQLINYFDHYLSLSWIAADGFMDVDGSKEIVYTVIESVSKSDSSLDLPSRRDLEYAELRLYTWQASGYFSSSDENPLQFCNYYEGENSWAEWNDKGIITKMGLSQNEYEWLFTNHADEIKEYNCSYEYCKEYHELTITQLIPFQNFNYSLPKDKYRLAENFYHSARIDVFLVEELLGDMEAEEPEENPQIKAVCPSETVPQKMDFKYEEESEETEPDIRPSVIEVLGPNWKKHFQKSKTIKKILVAVAESDSITSHNRRGWRKESGNINDRCAYKFIKVNSVTQIGTNREIIIASFMNKESGLIEKWSIDVSPFPTLDQMMYVLYDVQNDCARKIVIYFKDFGTGNVTDPEIKIENEAATCISDNVSSYSDSVYDIWTIVIHSYSKKGKFEITFLAYPRSSTRRKVPARSVFESEFWDSYYYHFVTDIKLKDKERSDSKLIADLGQPYSKVPFLVKPEWTEKGLFMRLYAISDCPETNWLMKFKMDELKRRYNGRDLQRFIEPYAHYCIVINLHEAPVSDFIESSALAKFNYASDFRKQQLDMIRDIEEIFQDYVPEETLSE